MIKNLVYYWEKWRYELYEDVGEFVPILECLELLQMDNDKPF